MTQKERVLDWMRRNGTITPRDAVYHLHIYRLADVIYRLKKMGYVFKTEELFGQNEYGKWRCASYAIDEQKTRERIAHRRQMQAMMNTFR